MAMAPSLTKLKSVWTHSQAHGGILGCVMQGQELDFVIFVSLFQLRIFYDLITCIFGWSRAFNPLWLLPLLELLLLLWEVGK